MDNLSERQKLILSLVIHEYTRSPQPVGSGTLVRNYNLDFSPATVRNELAALTEMDFLRQPHTSAGRIPSEKGYRYFVGRLLQETVLPDSTRHMISHQFYQSAPHPDQWMRLAASVLAHQSGAASLVTAPHPERSLVKHIELISTFGRQVLMVIVFSGGEVRQRMITLEDPQSQERLSQIAENLTVQLQVKGVNEIQAALSKMSGLEYEFTHWLIQMMRESASRLMGEVFTDGFSNVLEEPEFLDSKDARMALKLLEEPRQLNQLLNRSMVGNGMDGIQVIIGCDGVMDELSQFSVVLARYGLPGVITGTLGVLGPIRMPYGRMISTVRYISRIMSDLVTESVNEGYLLN